MNSLFRAEVQRRKTRKNLMSQMTQTFLFLTAVVSIAVADIFLKKAALAPTLGLAFRTPWMAAAMLLYLYQIFFLTYFFIAGWDLSRVSSLQTVVYIFVAVGAGLVFFKESLTAAQFLGVILASAGAVLITK